jgi:acetyltransferase
MHIRTLNPAEFEIARPSLVALLLDVVASGGSLGFQATLDKAAANDYWSSVKAAIEGGAQLLFVAERNGALYGSVQLQLCSVANGVNRAEVQKLMVHPEARRAGAATALMTALEAEALRRERGLLLVDTEAGAGAEKLCRALRYSYLGSLPDYACSPKGEWRANAIYFKTMFKRSAR